MKKIFRGLLVLAVVLMPSLVNAEEVVVNNEKDLRSCIEVNDNVCKLGADITLSGEKIVIDNNVTIDGDGNNIFGVNDNASIYFEIVDGTFTIKNVNVSKFGGAVATVSRNGIFKIPSEAPKSVKLVATNLKITDFNRSAFDLSSGTFDISNVVIDCSNSNTASTILTKGILVGVGTNKVVGTIADSTITNSVSKYDAWNTAGIEVYNNAEVTVKNVNISKVKLGVSVDNYYYDTYGDSKVIVENSTIAADQDALRIYSKADAQSIANVIINSGNFTGNVKYVNKSNNDSIIIRGGSYSTDVKEMVDTGYLITESNGKYVVTSNDKIETEDGNVSFEGNALPNDWTLEVIEEKLEDKEKNEILTSAKDLIVKNDGNKFVIKNAEILGIYDINVKEGDKIVSIEGTDKYKISFKLDEKLTSKYNSFKVVYIDENGNVKETYDATLNEDGTISFETTHLSTYAIIGYNAEAIEAENPNTFDGIGIYAVLGLISLMGLTMTIFKSKRKMI